MSPEFPIFSYAHPFTAGQLPFSKPTKKRCAFTHYCCDRRHIFWFLITIVSSKIQLRFGLTKIQHQPKARIKEPSMEKIEMVCACCQRVDSGNGVWLVPTDQSTTEPKRGLCPECCHQRFPQFYSDYNKRVKHRKGFGRFFSSFNGIFKA